MSNDVIVTIRLREVLRMTGLKKSTIYSKMKNESFPKSIQISDGAVGWLENEVQDWLRAKVEKRNGYKGQK